MMAEGEHTSLLHEALHNIARSATARHDKKLPGCGARMHASMHAFATYTPLPHPLAASLARTPHLLPDVSAASLANDIISAADVLSCSHPRSYVFLILALTSVYSEFARADMANNVRLEIHLREAYQSIAATRSLLLA